MRIENYCALDDSFCYINGTSPGLVVKANYLVKDIDDYSLDRSLTIIQPHYIKDKDNTYSQYKLPTNYVYDFLMKNVPFNNTLLICDHYNYIRGLKEGLEGIINIEFSTKRERQFWPDYNEKKRIYQRAHSGSRAITKLIKPFFSPHLEHLQELKRMIKEGKESICINWGDGIETSVILHIPDWFDIENFTIKTS